MKTQQKAFLAAFVLLFIISFSNSCRKDFSLNEIDNLSTDSLHLEGTFAAPLIDSRLKLLDFIPGKDSSLWAEVRDNIVHLRMYYEDVMKVSFNDIYHLPLSPIPAGTPVLPDTISVRSDTSKLKVYDNMLSGRLFFQNPSITFHVKNNIPIVTFFKADTLTFHNYDGDSLSNTGLDEFIINAPTAPGTTAYTDIVMDTTEVPVLDEVFSPVPRFISFYLSAGSHTTQNLPFELTGEEQMHVDADIDLPLDARLDTIVLGDTIKTELFNDERVQSVTLKIRLDNGFPLDGYAQIYFANQTTEGTVILVDSVFTDLTHANITEDGWHLVPAETNADGIVTTSNESEILVIVDQARVKKLLQSQVNKMIITGKLDSYNSASGQYVKILGTYDMGIKAAVKIDFKGDTNEF